MLARKTRKMLVETGRLRFTHVSGLNVDRVGGVPLDQSATHASVAGVYHRGRVYFGFALCSVGDNFSRKEGRRQAQRRLLELLRGETTGSKKHTHFSLALAPASARSRKLFIRDRAGRVSYVSAKGLLTALEKFLDLPARSLTARPALVPNKPAQVKKPPLDPNLALAA